MKLGDVQYLVVFQATTYELSAVIYSQPILSAISTALYQQLLSLTNEQCHQLLLSPSSYYPLLATLINYLPLSAISFYYLQPLSSIFHLLSVVYYQLYYLLCATIYQLLFIPYYLQLPTIYQLLSIISHPSTVIQLSFSICPLYLNSHTLIISHQKSSARTLLTDVPLG